MKYGRIISAAVCAAMMAGTVLPAEAFAEDNQMDEHTNIVIDGSKANLTESMLYRGAGMVSGNNSSRLLLDYKAENPEAYQEILEYLFGETGVGITHLKLEMGSDINSSSGTEPSVMRTADEKPDVTRGAGFQLAADAKKINPNLTLDMLWWSEPQWVDKAEDVYAARYKWYKGSLDGAYETYGLKFDYVSTTQNERMADHEWIKYLSNALKSETDCQYDYSAIKIVSGEEVGSWNIADKMLRDEELLEAIDVVGSHYTSRGTFSSLKLAKEYGKELWFSEGSSPMSYAQGTHRFDGNGSGLADLNGALDVANRVIMMYPNGGMTMCQFQPAVAAYYDGVCYCQKQFILASDPWSGYYLLDSGFFMSLHFSQFMKKGWAFIDGACYSDGQNGGDGHAIVDSVYSYVTSTNPSTGDYSTVITNTTAEPITYSFTVSNLAKASADVDIWETRGPDSGAYNENYFKKIKTVTPEEKDGAYSYSVEIAPCSIITVSTVAPAKSDYEQAPDSARTILALPYEDDFEYADYDADYLSSRGNAPRYTTDQGGAFEVESIDGNNVLKQLITPETKAKEWGSTPNPTTNFGDDRWYNYSVSGDVAFAESDEPDKNYAGIGLRYNSAYAGASGYWLRLYENGEYQLWKNNSVLESGSLDTLDARAWTNLKIEAVNSTVRCFINETAVIEYTAKSESVQSAGRAALFSSYNQNCFDNIKIEAAEEPYITRFDNTDYCCNYSGAWEQNTMGSFKLYKRTSATGSEGAVLTIDFDGTGFELTGETPKDSVISISVDGAAVNEAYTVPATGHREISYALNGLEKGAHKAEITVKTGTFVFDSVQISGGEAFLAEKTEEPATEEIPETETAEVTDAAAETAAAEEPKAEKNSAALPIAIGVGAAIICAALAGFGIAKKRKK